MKANPTPRPAGHRKPATTCRHPPKLRQPVATTPTEARRNTTPTLRPASHRKPATAGRHPPNLRPPVVTTPTEARSTNTPTQPPAPHRTTATATLPHTTPQPQHRRRKQEG